jgi:hypothetical protein
MRSLIKLAFVLLICLAGIGLYRGWFSLSRAGRDAEGHKANIDMSVDKGKIRSDVKKAERAVKDEIRELEGKAKANRDARPKPQDP